MLSPAVGLKTHIWNNNAYSIALMCMFPVLLLLLAFACFLILGSVSSEPTPVVDGVSWTLYPIEASWFSAPIYDALMRTYLNIPWILIAAGFWFLAAYHYHERIISSVMNARYVERRDEPLLYDTLENLCISRGLYRPKLAIIESPALNAFASGLEEKSYTITVTRGLLEALSPDELEAVLAHELTHIRNEDVRLLVISIIFVGIFSFVAELAYRGFLQKSRSSGRSDGRLKILGFILIGVGYLLSILVRFCLSRRREYLADAGAVELTKNSDALVRALEKISGKAKIPNMPDSLAEMCIENTSTGLFSMFSTHPPIKKRIETLRTFAG
ncbi:MAG: M48 family metallopeptidase [Holosporales bacterium]|jgi:heat shock protein HtpX